MMLKGVTFGGRMTEKQGALTKRVSSIIAETPESTHSPLSMSFDRERRWLSMKLETGPSDTEPAQCPALILDLQTSELWLLCKLLS